MSPSRSAEQQRIMLISADRTSHTTFGLMGDHDATRGQHVFHNANLKGIGNSATRHEQLLQLEIRRHDKRITGRSVYAARSHVF